MLLPDIHMTPNVARRVEAKVTKRPVRTRSAAQFGGDPVNPAEEKERCCSYDGVERTRTADFHVANLRQKYGISLRELLGAYRRLQAGVAGATDCLGSSDFMHAGSPINWAGDGS